MIIFAIIFAVLGFAAFVGHLVYENPNQDASEQDIINLGKLIGFNRSQNKSARILFWLSIALEFLSASMLFFAN